MKESDWELLQGLSLVTDLSEEQWGIVISDVEKAGGVRQVGGQARVEIERAVKKARTLVVKHPGQHDQSVHGGKGKGGAKAPTSAPASAGGGSGANIEGVTDVVNSENFRATRDEMGAMIGMHEKAVGRSKMTAGEKREAKQYLDESKEIMDKMPDAKSARELSMLHGDLVNAGENYKGVVRGANEDRRAKHYRSKRSLDAPYKDKDFLGGGLDPGDLQSLSEVFDIPFVD